jgi:nucleoid DNA-binding protein
MWSHHNMANKQVHQVHQMRKKKRSEATEGGSEATEGEQPMPPSKKRKVAIMNASTPSRNSSGSEGSGDSAADSDVSGSEDGGKKKRATSSAVSHAILEKMIRLYGSNELSHYKQMEVKKICDLFVKTIVTMVMNDEKVTLTNHVSFRRTLRKERDRMVPSKAKGQAKTVHKASHYVMTMEMKPALKARFDELPISDEDQLEPSSGSE